MALIIIAIINRTIAQVTQMHKHTIVCLCICVTWAIVRFIIAIIISATGHYYVKNNHWVVVQRQYLFLLYLKSLNFKQLVCISFDYKLI